MALLGAPSLGQLLLYLILQAFAVPVLTFTFGTIGWLLLNVLGSYWDARAWLYCCIGVGLPAACLVAWQIKRPSP
jgi:hypothetical protein